MPQDIPICYQNIALSKSLQNAYKLMLQTIFFTTYSLYTNDRGNPFNSHVIIYILIDNLKVTRSIRPVD